MDKQHIVSVHTLYESSKNLMLSLQAFFVSYTYAYVYIWNEQIASQKDYFDEWYVLYLQGYGISFPENKSFGLCNSSNRVITLLKYVMISFWADFTYLVTCTLTTTIASRSTRRFTGISTFPWTCRCAFLRTCVLTRRSTVSWTYTNTTWLTERFTVAIARCYKQCLFESVSCHYR